MISEEKIKNFLENTKNLIKEHGSQTERKMYEFFSNLRFRLNIFQTTEREMNVYLASKFNIFGHIVPDENRLSDIIVDLLDPDGKHGQRDVFLKEFLKIIGEAENYNKQKVKVIREEPTAYIEKSQRRIDITIDFGNFGIGVENKPWAMEQEEQIKDYRNHLMKKYNNNFLLVYLAGSGSEPRSIGESDKKLLLQKRKLRVLSYSGGLKKWLESCYKECKAEKVRWFLRDFIEYVERNFGLDHIE